MKELCSYWFDGDADLVLFVKTNKIKKRDIQQIIKVGGKLLLFVWLNTKEKKEK